MPAYEDECLTIELPKGWEPVPSHSGFDIDLGKNGGVTISVSPADPHNPPQQIIDGFVDVMSSDLYHEPPLFKATAIAPFHCGPHTGARVDQDYERVKICRVGLDVEGHYVYVQTMGLKDADNDLVWQAIGTLRLKPGLEAALAARLEALNNPLIGEDLSANEPPPKQMDATDLSKPRKVSFCEWMDHQMVLLMDRESYPENNPFIDAEHLLFLMPCSDNALWLTTMTEFDVTLEFVVRAKKPKPRKVWWNREAEATLCIPTGHLHVEQTTGGTLLDIKLTPGDYKVIAKGFMPEGADAGDEGVEKIQVTLVPISD